MEAPEKQSLGAATPAGPSTFPATGYVLSKPPSRPRAQAAPQHTNAPYHTWRVRSGTLSFSHRLSICSLCSFFRCVCSSRSSYREKKKKVMAGARFRRKSRTAFGGGGMKIKGPRPNNRTKADGNGDSR